MVKQVQFRPWLHLIKVIKNVGISKLNICRYFWESFSWYNRIYRYSLLVQWPMHVTQIITSNCSKSELTLILWNAFLFATLWEKENTVCLALHWSAVFLQKILDIVFCLALVSNHILEVTSCFSDMVMENQFSNIFYLFITFYHSMN